MRNKARIAFAAMLLCVFGMVLWTIVHERDPEPTYQGKPLSEWLERYIGGHVSMPDFRPEPEADEAVRRVGTNAIPPLLRMLRRHDSTLKIALMRLGDRLPLPGSWYGTRSPYYQHWQAATAFCALGAEASNAAPMLIQMFGEKVSLDSQCACAEALGWIGPSASAAVPTLMDGATNADRSVRVHAVMALGRIHTTPGLVLPLLFRSIQDPDKWVRRRAADSLAAFETNAFPWVPSLMTLVLTKTNTAAASALAGITPDGVRALSGALTKQSVPAAKASGEVCRVILQTLADHAFRLRQSTDGPLDRTARLKVDAEIAEPALFQSLESLDRDLRTTAAVALIGFGAGSSRSTAVLRVLHEDKSRAYWQMYTGLRLHMEEADSANGSFELFWLFPFLQYYDAGLRDAVTNTLIAIDPQAAASAGVDTNIVGLPH